MACQVDRPKWTTLIFMCPCWQASVQQLCGAGNQLVSLDTSKVILIWDLREMAAIQRLEAFKTHAVRIKPI